ncbi:MAG TPA: prolyl oligopeptidase family serine peptidase [Candidatus Bathyarchaeia archaeon]|nr:prolyl oligopeptidase family serine peptidase [Candidatus Bathyarchaeia archaeon]
MNDEEFLTNLLTVPDIYGLSLSLKGDKIAFSWKNIHPNVDVFYVDIKEQNDPIALTETPEMTRILKFYPKSDALLVMEDKSRNERMQIFRIDLNEPKKMIPLTEENPQHFMHFGDIHPNEKWLFYGANYDFDKKLEIEPSWVYRHLIETGERVLLAQPLKATWSDPEINKSGSHLIYYRKDLHPKGDQVWLVDIEGKEDRELLNFGAESRTYASWLPDSHRVAFMSDGKGKELQNYNSVGIYNLDNNEIEWLVDDPKSKIERIRVPKLGNYLLVDEVDRARRKTTIIDLKTKEQKTLPLIAGNLVPIGPIYDNSWIAYYYSSTQPIDVVKINLDSLNPNNFITLTKVWEKSKITKNQFTPALDFDWIGYDNLPIHGWLYKPPKPNGKTIIFIHGGPTYHSSNEINVQIQYYTHRGFLVLDPNYRGSTGYGYEFEDAIRKNGWGSDEQNDILAGVEALIKKGLATKNKIGITGTSYGGYSSYFAITKAPKELVAASAPICGMTDLVVDYKTTRPDLRPVSEQMLGGKPDEVPEIYYERSPINFVQNIQGSLLIIQGAQDPNVTPKNVEELRKRLDENSTKYEVLIFDDEGHGIVRNKNQKILYKRIADFFEKAL